MVVRVYLLVAMDGFGEFLALPGLTRLDWNGQRAECGIGGTLNRGKTLKTETLKS
jgi:hypothetical protein